MPSPRRLRVFIMVILALLMTTLFFTSKSKHGSSSGATTGGDFLDRTGRGLEQQHGGQGQVVMSGKGTTVDTEVKDKDGDGSVDEDDEEMSRQMSERLKAAEQKAKDLANKKAPLKPDRPSEVVGVGSSAGGQHKGKGKGKDKSKAAESDEEEPESDEEHEIEATLNAIFKKSPVIIFSKSYCPFSKRAKGVLLEKYTIEPAPYVVELDEHPLGKQLQARLGEMTGRKTVPNILINGKSVGGSDEIAELDSRKTLIDKFKSMGGKRLSMMERFVGSARQKDN
ncbi:glutaredoxin [Xylariomycetidae sp. FL2044]|nr:glutaredoxin [Xylariomycetidae sp. FL2044]